MTAVTPLSEKELARYHRQILIPEIGEEGQKKLKESKVFLGGVGGLGSISAYYLVAAGIGRVTIVDRDTVTLGNLNRQLTHWTTDLGKKKIDSAGSKLRRLNPNCRLQLIQDEMREDNVTDLVADSDLIVDGTDNFETRKALNRASLAKGIPFVYGGVDRLNGMVSTFLPGRTPCFECIFPGRSVNQGPIGVIGPLPGVIASLQTLEAIKIIVGMEGLLLGRLLFFSGTDMTFREIRIENNPNCTVCNRSG